MTSTTHAPARVPAAIVELATVLGLFAAYNLGRLLATGQVASADGNALRILDLQAALRLPTESDLQAAALGVDHLVGLADRYYLLHFPVTAAVLVWLWVRDRAAYRWAKRALVLATGVAMVVHLVVPVTPPRLLAAAGVVDTGQQAGTSVYGGSPVGGLANEYAALPSLHVGWALLVALVLVATLRTRWRWLWLAHPLLTTVTVVVTGNHYLLDAAAGAGLVVLGLLATRSAQRSAAGEEPRRTPQVRADGVRRQRVEHERERSAQPHRGLHDAAAGRRGEVEGQLRRDPAPGAALGPSVRAVELGRLHARAQARDRHVDPGLTDGRLAGDVLDAGQAGLPLRPMARVDQVVEGDLGRHRQVDHRQNVSPVSSS
jgi:hypothetical protein